MADNSIPTPEEAPIVILPEAVVFPHILTSLAFHDAKALAAIDEAMNRDPKTLVCVAVRPQEVSENGEGLPVPEGPPMSGRIYRTGTMVVIHKLLRIPAGGVAIMVQGYRRVKIKDIRCSVHG